MNKFKNLEKLTTIRQKEVFCPMIKARAICSPLKVSHDLSLRSAVMSPDLYDLHLSNLVFENITFPDLTGTELTFENFIDTVSYMDRQVLLWGILYASYNTLGKQDIICPHCDNKFKNEITIESTMQEDSLLTWDHDISFTDYKFNIVKEIEGIDSIKKIIFETSIPTISQHLAVLRLISSDKLKENYKKFNSLTSKSEDLTSVTRCIKIYKTDNDETPDVFDTILDIHHVITKYILLDLATDIFTQFNTEFSKYIPKFKKSFVCSQCNKQFDFNVDMEVSLFRQYFQEGL